MIKGSGSKRPKNIPTDLTDLDQDSDSDPRHCWRQFSGSADSYWHWISRIRIQLFSSVTFKVPQQKSTCKLFSSRYFFAYNGTLSRVLFYQSSKIRSY
jgi:hypothetical protein